MRITARQLRQIIKEELTRSMYEGDETSAAQTKVEPAPPERFAEVPEVLLKASVLFDGVFKDEMYAQAGMGDMIWQVSNGIAKFRGWKKQGGEMKIYHWFKGQGKKDTVTLITFGRQKEFDGVSRGIPVSAPDGTYALPAEAVIEGTNLRMNPKLPGSNDLKENRRRRI